MELRTRIDLEKSSDKITYSDPVIFIGSCFAAEMGSKLAEGKIPVMVNPSGTVYNPVSVINTLDSVISGKQVTLDDLYCHEGTWLSFSHYTDFSSTDPGVVLEKINSASDTARNYLSRSRFLFITFGTARVFRFKSTGSIVSNCHKLPSSMFIREILKPAEIVQMWNQQLDRLHTGFPDLKIIFTISPVRHWKDGAHGNQVSKSVLFLAIEELLEHPSSPGYFPSYEIMMDELRDYRFYTDDMLHPSGLAVDYIWEIFSDCYFDNSTLKIWKEAEKITRAMKHRILSENSIATVNFADKILSRITSLEHSCREIDLSVERDYFSKLLG